jgi:uncharacterized protein YbaP (TraB family)
MRQPSFRRLSRLLSLLKRLQRAFYFGLLYCALANCAFADGLHSLWAVQGKQNTVYLLGSIHLLRASESIPVEIEDAYRDANTLVMEIDMDDLDPLAAQETTMRLGMLPPGESLPDQLTPDAAAKLAAYTQRLGLPSGMLNPFRPWLAAITLTQLHLVQLGFDPQSGIEQRMVIRAAADHKEILGLETMDEQLGILANLSPKMQIEFLMQTLTEADQVETEINGMVQAWRKGDTAALEKFLLDMKESPEIYRALVADRNRRWMTRLNSMLNERQDYLVIVGAMHLVGKDGVVELLRQRGFKIQQH